MAKSETPTGSRVPATTTAPVVPMPDPRSMESMWASIGRGAAHYASDTGLLEAQRLMYEAFDARGQRRAALARQALVDLPDCADAYLLLAEETASSAEEARELLEQGVAAGERALGPEPFEEDVGHFWGLLETRPYMRARAALAETRSRGTRPARGSGRTSPRACFRPLKPNDNQGLRDRQAEWLLWLERYEELDALFAAYDEDAGAALAYSKALAAFHVRAGASPVAEQLLVDAREANPHVGAFLTGRKGSTGAAPRSTSGLGDETEAVDYAVGATALWTSVPGALAWLQHRYPDTPGESQPPSRSAGLSDLASDAAC